MGAKVVEGLKPFLQKATPSTDVVVFILKKEANEGPLRAGAAPASLWALVCFLNPLLVIPY